MVRQDADDGHRLSVEAERSPHDIRIPTESRGPEAVPKKHGPGTSGEATLDAAKRCVFLEPGNPISGIQCTTKLPTTNYEVAFEAASGVHAAVRRRSHSGVGATGLWVA